MYAGTAAEAAAGGVRRRVVPSRRRLAALVLLGALLGGAAGFGALHRFTEQRAVALLDLSDALAVATGGHPTTDQADRFVQSELLYLNSTTFAHALEVAVPVDTDFALSAAQVGDTDVIQVVAEAPAGPDAIRLADGAVATYDTHRRTALTARADDVQEQLATARAALDAAGEDADTDTRPLQARVTALQAQLNDAQVAASARGVGGTVVQSAADGGFTPTLSLPVAVGAGVALGVLAGLLLAVLPRLISRRIWSPEDAVALGVPVLRPVLPAGGRGWLAALADRPSDDPLETAARLLATRMGALDAEDRPLLLVGAAPGMGTSFAAVNVAAALARRRQTVLVAAADVAGGRVADWFTTEGADLARLGGAPSLAEVEAELVRSPVDGLYLLPAAPSSRWEPAEAALPGVVALLLAAGWAVVVDAPPAVRSGAAAELARLRPLTAVVARVGEVTEDALEGAAGVVGGEPVVVLTAAPDRAGRQAGTARRPLAEARAR